MSISPALLASARSAYRNLYRASSSTFASDDHVLKAFRAKMRADAVGARTITDPAAYEQCTQLARGVADVLRRNVVQAVKVTGSADQSVGPEDRWRLRITKDTELGSNETINNPPPVKPSNRSMRKKEKDSNFAADVVPSLPSYNLPALRKAHKFRTLPELREEDLVESFVKGSGPGGQSINKTENNVQLLHKPTGIRVSCQSWRSLDLNRRHARKLMFEKLDKLANPGIAKDDLQRALQQERTRRRRRKQEKKWNREQIEKGLNPGFSEEVFKKEIARQQERLEERKARKERKIVRLILSLVGEVQDPKERKRRLRAAGLNLKPV